MANYKYSQDVTGARIREKREMMNMTQESLCDLIKMSVPKLSKIENGQQPVQVDELVRFCEVLDVDANYLLNYDVPSASDAKYIADATGLSEESVEVLMNHGLSNALLMGISEMIKEKRIMKDANSTIHTFLPFLFDKNGEKIKGKKHVPLTEAEYRKEMGKYGRKDEAVNTLSGHYYNSIDTLTHKDKNDTVDEDVKEDKKTE